MNKRQLLVLAQMAIALFLLRLPRTLAHAPATTASTAAAAVCRPSQTVPRAARMRSTPAPAPAPRSDSALNVLGEPLQLCCSAPRTGYFRDGFCHTGPQDAGVHTVCAIVTDAFLRFSRERGNDLMSPAPRFGFPGLRDGDRWCLCVSRWKEALDAGVAPPVVLAATHQRALTVVTLQQLSAHAVDA